MMKREVSFGDFVRTERLKKGITLRKFAQSVDLSATYVSRMERDEVTPPSEEKIFNMASFLGIDPDYLIVMAKKVPEEIQEMLFDRPELVGFLRKAHKKTDAELEDMTSIDSKNES